MKDTIPINAAMGWEAILTDENRHRLESHDLPKFLVKQRWFAGKSGIIESVRLVEWAPLEASHSFLSLIEVRLQGGAVDMYLLPLAMTASTGVEGLERTAPNMVIAPIIAGRTSGLLCDGSYDDRTCQSLFSLVENATEIRANHGRICGVRGKAFSMVLGNRQPPLPVRRGSAEQSNTSILYGEGFILKLFRRPEAGENPDCEIGRYLTENTRFERIPPFAGMLLHVGRDSSEPRTLAMLQGLVKNQGDGWTWSLEELRRYYQISAARQFPQQAARDLGGEDDTSLKPPSSFAASALGGYTDSAALLGRRTAELHLALATPTSDRRFMPEALTRHDLETLLTGFRDHGAAVFRLLEEQLPSLPPDVKQIGASVLALRERVLDSFAAPAAEDCQGQRIRVHGDYHLGQVLRTQNDFVILDFEGEPARPLAERRQKQCPLKDVAGMMRSFSYAAYAGLLQFSEPHSQSFSELMPWAQLWERSAVRAFLHSYHQITAQAGFWPSTSADFLELLNLFLLDKALYEVRYELNSRPAWLSIPLLGILAALKISR